MRYGSNVRTVFLIALLVASFATWALKDETLEELMARADRANIEDRPALCIEVAQRQLKSADELYRAGDTNKAKAAINEVVAYSQEAHDASAQTGKRLKNTEIALRKMAEKLRDIKSTLNYADQAPVQAAANKLEAMRTDLLSRMFGKERK